MSYNRDSPGMSKITASGNWRRQLWEHLEDVVASENCKWMELKTTVTDETNDITADCEQEADEGCFYFYGSSPAPQQ